MRLALCLLILIILVCPVNAEFSEQSEFLSKFDAFWAQSEIWNQEWLETRSHEYDIHKLVLKSQAYQFKIDRSADEVDSWVSPATCVNLKKASLAFVQGKIRTQASATCDLLRLLNANRALAVDWTVQARSSVSRFHPFNLENYNEVRHQLVENSSKDDKALQELVEAVLRERAFLR